MEYVSEDIVSLVLRNGSDGPSGAAGSLRAAALGNPDPRCFRLDLGRIQDHRT